MTPSNQAMEAPPVNGEAMTAQAISARSSISVRIEMSFTYSTWTEVSSRNVSTWRNCSTAEWM